MGFQKFWGAKGADKTYPNQKLFFAELLRASNVNIISLPHSAFPTFSKIDTNSHTLMCMYLLQVSAELEAFWKAEVQTFLFFFTLNIINLT